MHTHGCFLETARKHLGKYRGTLMWRGSGELMCCKELMKPICVKVRYHRGLI